MSSFNNKRVFDSKGARVSLSPSPIALIESLRSVGYTVDTALADLIDNSISAESTWISTRFLWNDGNPWLAVIDNGCGMRSDALRNAMRFGSQSPLVARDKTDLGRFGLGLKTASISQCRRLTVCSKTPQGTSACEWDLDFLTQSGSEEWLLSILDQTAILDDGLLSDLAQTCLQDCVSGTIVLWRAMDAMLAGTEHIDSERKFNELMDNARKHLETVFHRFLSPDPGYKSVKMDFNNSPLLAFNPFGPNIPARQELPLEKVYISGEVIEVQPYVLPHKSKPGSEYERFAGDDGYLQNQGFYVYRNRRLIVKSTWFRLIKKEELNKLIRIRVDIPNSLDHMWSINIDKSHVSPPEIVRKQLKNIIQRISGAGKQVFVRKAAVLKNRHKIPVWKRVVRDGNIAYTVNFEHPMITDIIENTDAQMRRKVEQLLNVVALSFPMDVFYTDKANDNAEVCLGALDATEAVALCRQLIDAYRNCDLTAEEIKLKLDEIELPGISPEILDSLLQEESLAHE